METIKIPIEIKTAEGERLEATSLAGLRLRVWTQSRDRYLAFSGVDVEERGGRDYINAPAAELAQLEAGVIEYSYSYTDAEGESVGGKGVTDLFWRNGGHGGKKAPGIAVSYGMVERLSGQIEDNRDRIEELQRGQTETREWASGEIEDKMNEIQPIELAEVVDDDTLEGFEKLTRDELKLDLFIDLWNDACKIKRYGSEIVIGRYNPETKLFELNGITDISYEEAVRIMNFRTLTMVSANGSPIAESDIRTIFPFRAIFASSTYSCFSSLSKLEVIPEGSGELLIGNFGSCFAGCKNLRKIDFRISATSGSAWLQGCESLETIRLEQSNSISLEWCPKLTQESFSYLIKNSRNGSTPITITVHADVYAKMTGDASNEAAGKLTLEESAQWQKLMTDAAAKNIAFAA